MPQNTVKFYRDETSGRLYYKDQYGRAVWCDEDGRRDDARGRVVSWNAERPLQPEDMHMYDNVRGERYLTHYHDAPATDGGGEYYGHGTCKQVFRDSLSMIPSIVQRQW